MREPVLRPVAAALALTLAWAAPFSPPARAETFSAATTDHRTLLHFRVPEEIVRRVLPAGWQADPPGSGPAQGANLVLILLDQIMAHDAQGRPAVGGTNQFAVLAVPGRDPATGEAGLLVFDGFSAKAEGAPGFYRAYERAEVRMERAVRAGSGDARRGEESWAVAGPGGDRLEVRLRYAGGTPVHSAFEARPRSARDPATWRIYRVEQGADVLRSGPAGVDRVEEFAFNASGPRLGALFDGTQRLVAVLSVPSYVRQIFLP